MPESNSIQLSRAQNDPLNENVVTTARACGALASALFVIRASAAGATTTIIQSGSVEIIISRADGERHVTSRTASAPQAIVAPQSISRSLIRTALTFIGTPYVWGGASPSGFDCSGFTWYAFSRLGIRIPRTADQQFAAGRPVPGYPLPGDLVFFQTYDYGASHVGIYLGHGEFVNAIGSNVHIASFASGYFRSRYLGARRFLPT